jgi:predicted ribosomally synthesized peptide with SipW-like signal peptide
MVVVAAAILGVGTSAVFSDRSDPPPLPAPP